MKEDLRKWFKEKWVNIGKKVDGKHPPCGTSGEDRGYAKCVPASKAKSMSKKEKESATRRKRAAQNKADRGGKESGSQGKTPIYVNTKPKNEDWSKKYKKTIDCNNPQGFSQKAHCAGRKARQSGKDTESKSVSEMTIEEKLNLFLEKNCPTDPEKWSASKSAAREKFDVYPSAYANAWAAKNYKGKGGGWESCKESVQLTEGCWDGYKQIGMKELDGRMVPNCVPINENNHMNNEPEKDSINEDLNILHAILLANAGVAVGGALAFIYNHFTLPAHYEYRSMWQRVKDWWSKGKDNAAIEKIVKRLNADPEVIAFAKNKKSTGWKELLKKKLKGSEISYLNKIYKNHIEAKEEQTQYLPDNPSLRDTDDELDYGSIEPAEEYDVENYDDVVDFIAFMRDYNKQLSEAGCGCVYEAEYQGREVKLGKIMQGDVKKFKVYVKNPKGNVVKVNFGQGGDAKGGTMRIRKSNPKARASFRARHNCDNPGPRHKARYWSCRKW